MFKHFIIKPNIRCIHTAPAFNRLRQEDYKSGIRLNYSQFQDSLGYIVSEPPELHSNNVSKKVIMKIKTK